MRGLAQVRGDDVVGVFAQLVARESDDEFLNRAGREREQQRAAGELEEAVEALEDDADLERDVQLGLQSVLLSTWALL